MEDLVAFHSESYRALLAMLVFARGMDFLSTWIATPRMLLEANPLAKKMGWRWGLVVNLALCIGFSFWALPAIVITTTSLMVAARNFQSAWIMRSMGEARYQCWIAERLAETHFGLYLGCLFGQTSLVALIGGALVYYSQWQLVPFGIGIGVLTYSVAVVLYTLLAVWRLRRAGGFGGG